MATIQANGIDIYYEEHGSGDPLLLIMGWGGNAASWRPQLSGLAERFRVIVFDNRGVGRTSAPDRPYSIPQMAHDTVELLDALEIPRAHVFGISMGGMIAQEMAIEHPGRIDKLILGCTTPGGNRAAGVARLHSDVSAFREQNGQHDLEWFSEFLLRLWTQEAMTKSATEMQDFVFSLIRFPPTTHGLTHQAAAVLEHDTHDRLSAIVHETLVMTGDDDLLIDPQNSVILAKKIPNAQLLVFEGLRHAFHLEKPKLTNRAIIEFLQLGPIPFEFFRGQLVGPRNVSFYDEFRHVRSPLELGFYAWMEAAATVWL